MNFEFARENMVKQQVMCEGIHVGPLVNAMIEIPRENFLPEDIKNLAYCDMGFVVDGRAVRSPALTAKLIYALNIKSIDTVLKLGLECGYVAALLAKISESVDILDYCDEGLGELRRTLADIDIYNINFNNAEHITNIIETEKRYSCIYVSTTVNETEIDQDILDLLEVGGRAVFAIDNDSFDKAYLVTRVTEENFEQKFLFDIYNK